MAVDSLFGGVLLIGGLAVTVGALVIFWRSSHPRSGRDRFDRADFDRTDLDRTGRFDRHDSAGRLDLDDDGYETPADAFDVPPLRRPPEPVRPREATAPAPMPAAGSDTDEMLRHLLRSQSELSGRISHLAEAQALAQTQLSDRFQAQERHVGRLLEERIDLLSHRIGEGLQASSDRTHEQMGEVRERLAVIDAAQKTMTALSGQILGLQDILSNKQTRGAFGEVQLHDLITATLPPSVYRFQAPLSNGRRVDCMLTLPNPPGCIAIDAKFPLESYHALQAAKDDSSRTQAARSFSADLLKHVRDIADRYIIAGETAESALMFLPSEAVYAELHARFPDVVEKSYRARVWIVSPTTLMATLTTIRAVLKDATMSEQAGIIQSEVIRLLDDLRRLDTRVGKLASHFAQAQDDVRQLQITTDKIIRHGQAIEALHVGGSGPEDQTALLPGTPPTTAPTATTTDDGFDFSLSDDDRL